MMNHLIAADIFRGFVLLLGGFTMGWGVLIAGDRAKQLKGRNEWLRRAAIWLCIAHVYIVLYIMLTIASRLNTTLTWRTPAAFVLFAIKLWFLYCLHRGSEKDAVDGRYRDSVPPRQQPRAEEI